MVFTCRLSYPLSPFAIDAMALSSPFSGAFSAVWHISRVFILLSFRTILTLNAVTLEAHTVTCIPEQEDVTGLRAIDSASLISHDLLGSNPDCPGLEIQNVLTINCSE